MAINKWTYKMIDNITNPNSKIPPKHNPNIKGQSCASSSLLMSGVIVSDRPWSTDINDPLIASLICLAESGKPVSGSMTTKLTVPFSRSIRTRISPFVKFLKSKGLRIYNEYSIIYVTHVVFRRRHLEIGWNSESWA
jgi:hypothetical protein